MPETDIDKTTIVSGGPEKFPAIPGYKIERKIGSGGMADVYLAEQQNFERQVALKVLSKNNLGNQSAAERFLREARLAAKLSHHCIVPIYDIVIQDNVFCMAMEYVPGGDLRVRLKEGLQLADGLKIISSVAQGLDYAGEKGLVHRDIKPENILFREDGSPLIADFGIARQIDSETMMTVTGTIIGTPKYMSPEQAQGLETDARSDLYSLGVILYEMLTGDTPFDGDSIFTIGMKHINEPPPPLEESLASFQAFLDKALAKNPADRFPNGKTLAEALELIEREIPNDLTQRVTVSTSHNDSKSNSASKRSSVSTSKTVPVRTITSRITAGLNSPKKFLWLTVSLSLALAIGLPLTAWLYFTIQKTPNSQGSGQVAIGDTNMADPQKSLLSSKSVELLEKAKLAYKQNRLFEPAEDNTQYYLTTLLALTPNNADALEKIKVLYNRYAEDVQEALADNHFEDATTLLNQAAVIIPYINDPQIQDTYATLLVENKTRQQNAALEKRQSAKISVLLELAERALNEGKLTSPVGENAYEFFQQILIESPDNEAAQKGLKTVADRLLEQAKSEVAKNDFSMAKALVAAVSQIAPEHPDIFNVRKEVQQAESEYSETVQKNTEDSKKVAVAKQSKLEEQLQSRQVQVKVWLQLGNQRLQTNNLLAPKDDNALHYFNLVIDNEPTNVDALRGKEQIGKKLIARATELAEAQSFDEGRRLLSVATDIMGSKVEAIQAERNLDRLYQKATIDRLTEKADIALKNDRLTKPASDNAHKYFQEILAIDGNNLHAQQGVKRIGQRYIELAESSIEVRDLEKADSLLEQAARFVPSSKELEKARALLDAAR